VLFAAPYTTLGADATSQSEFWPEWDAYVGLSDHTRLYFQYTATREKQPKDYSDGQIGGFLDVYMLPLLRYGLREHPDAARSKYLMFRIGYAYSYNPAQGKKRPPSITFQ
jgi:hypothetical protein